MPEPAANAPETETESKQSRGLGSYVAWVFVVVMVYVLNSGPGFRSALKNPKWLAATRVVYWPLVNAYLHTPLRRPLGMYWHLWIPEAFDSSGNPGRS